MQKLHIIIYIISAVIFSGCEKSGSWHRASGVAWGTSYDVKYFGGDDLNDSIVAVIHDVEMALSPFEKGSNVSRINSGETDTLGAMLADIFRISRDINSLSDGMFDPTVAPLVNLWGFGPQDVDNHAPDSAAIAAAVKLVGIADCRLDANNVLVRKNPHTTFDFSGVAKGYGIDCIAAMLKRNGVTDFMVEVGGELSLSGHNPEGGAWHIQVDAPTSGLTGHDALRVLDITDCCVATSGNYRNRRVLDDGSEAWHTISPVTGYPVSTDVASATVIAPTCARADALATAAMAMTSQRALTMLRGEEGVSALLVTRRGSIMACGPLFRAGVRK